MAGIGDFDDNGKDDILFSNSAGTALGYYADALTSGWTNVGAYSNAWEVEGIGDFDGNGKDDILFAEIDGNSLGYYADGSASNWNNIGTYSADWEVLVA